jgi:hypothetical protein
MAGMIALLRMTAGLIVWAIAFCALYGLSGIGCAAGWASARTIGGLSVHHATMLAAWLACIAAASGVCVALRRHGDSMIDKTSWTLAVVGLLATIVTGLPIVLVPACL